MLKRYVGETKTTSTELPPLADHGEIIMEPEAMIDTRWIQKGSNFVEESLVRPGEKSPKRRCNMGKYSRVARQIP